MVKIHTPIIIALALICLLSASSWLNAETFETVDPSVLLENPQSYWAKGIVFRDIFEGPAPDEKNIRINREYYDPFKIKKVCSLSW